MGDGVSGYTPGPWFWNDSANLDRLLGKDKDGSTVAVLAHDTESYVGQVREADARLIAAAPRLAKLLIYIEDQGYEPPETAAEIRTLLSEIGVEFDVST